MPSAISRTLSVIRKKPPTAADGMQEEQFTPEVKDTSVFHDLTHLKGSHALTLAQALKDMSSGEPLDDRKLLLEHGVSMLQTLPPNSGLSHTISDGFIGMLWGDIPHPVPTYVGPQSRYRKADGSGTSSNPDPRYGAAGSPYSRTVPPVTPKPASLPDPELVFDQLLRRRDGTFREHPSGLNRFFFSFATMVIHEIFKTDQQRPWINLTSSYVELSVIYGDSQEEQDRVRAHEQGLLLKDTIASARIMMMPPPVVALVMTFARHHNHIAHRIFEVNEAGKYKPWSTLSDAEKKWQDEDIFQLARNVNVAFFASVVLRDYVNAILNTPRQNTDWHLELGKEIKQPGGKRLERGTGNVCSIEFACLYHWHASLSAADAKWMEDVLKTSIPNYTSVDEVTPQQWKQCLGGRAMKLVSTPPNQWEFGGLKRGPDGSFDDAALSEILKDAIEEPAHALGARGAPPAMKLIEMMGMLQTRVNHNACTMNEFRKYLNLKPFESFLEWNSDPEVAAAAESLYGHIDALELYPGLHAEEMKPAMPGSGVCPPHTVGRGILDDAVALVRGDRFLTYDLNSSTLTNWGVSQLKAAPGAYGGILPKVLFNVYPLAFGGYSTYALLPFYRPDAARKFLKDSKVLDKYDTQRPSVDQDGVPKHGLHTYDACKEAFANRDLLRVPYGKDIDRVCGGGTHFFISYDDAARHDPDSARMHRAFFEPNFEKNVDKYYREHTQALIKKRTVKYYRPQGKCQLDVVRDICNVVPITWLANKYAIPLKTEETPKGLISVFELHSLLVACFIYCSFNQIPSSQWTLRHVAETMSPIVRSIFKARMKVNSGLSEKVHDYFAKNSAYEVSEQADHLYHTLIKEKIEPELAVTDLLGTCIPIAGNITQQTSLLIDLFLSEGYEYAKERVIQLAKQDDEVGDKELEGWIIDGMRHAGVVFGLPRTVAKDVVIQDGDRTLDVKAGDRLIIATSKAHMDPKAFPNPERLDPTRDRKSYLHMGFGLHFCFGARLVVPSIRAMLKEIFKLPNIRRAPYGGKFVRITETLGQDAANVHLYLDHHSSESPVPTSMKIEFDEIPATNGHTNGKANGVH